MQKGVAHRQQRQHTAIALAADQASESLLQCDGRLRQLVIHEGITACGLQAFQARLQHRIIWRRKGQFVYDDQTQCLTAHVDTLPERRGAQEDRARALDEQGRLAGAIADRDQRLELVLAASRTGIWEFDLVSRTHTWSDQMYEQLRRSRAAGPEDVIDRVAPDQQAAVREQVREAIERRAPFQVDLRLDFPDEERWIHLRGRPFYDDEDGSPVRLLGTSEDITERVRLDRQRAALEAQETRSLEFQRAFIDVLSHELRTPMTTIYAAAEMLRRPHSSLSDEDRRGLLSDIHDETRRLDGLIENLLVLSRSERSAIEAMADPVDLRRAIDAVIRAESARWPGVTFSVGLPDDLPLASGSDGYVGRILANLVSNAGKYASPGGKVGVTAEVAPEEIVVRVRDDGLGIDVDPDRLFELFYRAPSAARHAAGSGIGLFVCARLVEAMAGRIWATALPRGAEFGFALRRFDELPLTSGPGPAATVAPAGAPASGPDPATTPR